MCFLGFYEIFTCLYEQSNYSISCPFPNNYFNNRKSMTTTSPIILPHGGYNRLIVFHKSDLILQGTIVFCRRFLPRRGDRTVDQMVQAARSGKQNIAEGSTAAGTSREMEIKLTNVARASLFELLEDYKDYLASNKLATWPINSKTSIELRQWAKATSEWGQWREYFETSNAEMICNAQLVLINQAIFLLARLLKSQESDFTQHGGLKERMYAARNACRGGTWEQVLFSWLTGAESASDLQNRAMQVSRKVASLVRETQQKHGW